MFVAHVLTKPEYTCSVKEGEALAIMLVLRHCEHLLYGTRAVIIADHRALTFINSGFAFIRNLAGKWSSVNKFDYRLEYI